MHKTEIFRFRLSPDDRKKIEELAKLTGCQPSAAIRQAIKQALEIAQDHHTSQAISQDHPVTD